MVVLVVWILVLSSEISAQERWVYNYRGPGIWSNGAYSVVMGADGNVYAAGFSFGTGLDDDFTVVSLTSWGGERWVYRHNGPGNGDDGARSVVMGADSNLYAAGYSRGIGTYSDFTVVSITSWGGERWVYRYNGPANASDMAYSILMGTDGNLYAAGTSDGSGTDKDFTLVSLDTGGVERWVYRYDGPDGDYDVAYSIVMGTDGNLYAAGLSSGSGTSWDFTVVSVTPSGGERWVYRNSGPGGNQDRAYSIVAGANGDLYAAGHIQTNGTFWDLSVISLDSLGTERWVYQYDGPGNGSDVAYSIVVGTDGNLYAAGGSAGSGTNADFIVASLDSSGTGRWVYRYNGPGNRDDEAKSIALGSDGNLYAAGYSYGSGTVRDFTVVSLTPSGDERWVHNYDGTASENDEANSVVMGTDGNIYAAGKTDGIIGNWGFTVISLNPDVGVVEAELRPSQSPKLKLSVSPVPAMSGMKIYYSLPKPYEVRLSVYDVSGKLVKELANAKEESGSKVLFWEGKNDTGERVASGTYFIQLKAGNSYASAKIIVL